MPGGVGRVSEAMLAACSAKDRTIASTGNANEIFYHLHASRVYLDGTKRYLYFVDSPGGKVKSTILAALAGMREVVEIEQLHLDAHRFFNGARRVSLTTEQEVETVLIALRLAGVALTVAQPSA